MLGEPGEEVHLVEQRRVLDDQCVGLHDRFAQADLAVVDAAVGHHRGSGALRSETGKRLCVPAFAEGGN